MLCHNISDTGGQSTNNGWRKRLFAYLLAKNGHRIDKLVSEYKQSLLPGLSGTVLEIGPGTGDNFAYFSPGITWIGIEPNRFMHPYIMEKAKKFGITADLRHGYAERIDIGNNSIDAVVSTHVLCSVSEPSTAVQEIVRVLKPGGKFVFIEHITASEGTFLRKVQSLIRPMWGFFADGCRPDSDTQRILKEAGFECVSYQRFRMSPRLICPVSPHIYGLATKAL